jgi:hypothetical protein
MDNHQVVPKSPRLGSEAFSPDYAAIWHAPHSTSSFTHVPTSELQVRQVITQD